MMEIPAKLFLNFRNLPTFVRNRLDRMNRHLIIGLAMFVATGNMVFAQEAKTDTTTTVAKQPDVENQLDISVTDNRLKVTNATVGNKLEIFSIVGIKVKEFEIKEASGEYLLNIAKGYYIVRIGEVTRKLVIR